eukprot:Awhi_evm1s14342
MLHNLEQQKSILEEELSVTKIELETLKTKANADQDQKDTELLATKTALKEKEESYIEAERVVEGMKVEVTQFKDKIQLLETLIEDKEKLYQMYEKETITLKETLLQKNKLIDDQVEALALQKQEHDLLTNVTTALKDSLEEKKQSIIKKEQECDALSKDMLELKESLEQNRKQQEENELKLKELQDLKSRVEMAEIGYLDKENQCTALKRDFQEKESKLETQSLLDQLHLEMDTLQETNRKANDQLKNLTDANKEYADVKATLEETLVQMEAKEKEIAACQEQLETLTLLLENERKDR